MPGSIVLDGDGLEQSIEDDLDVAGTPALGTKEGGILLADLALAEVTVHLALVLDIVFVRSGIERT